MPRNPHTKSLAQSADSFCLTSKNFDMEKRYFATIAGARIEITKERADQIKRLQAIIRAQRAKVENYANVDCRDCFQSATNAMILANPKNL